MKKRMLKLEEKNKLILIISIIILVNFIPIFTAISDRFSYLSLNGLLLNLISVTITMFSIWLLLKMKEGE